MKVSVVVPVWNPGPNLARCLASLLAQSMSPSDYELVLVDDGSTDGTAGRLDELARQLGERVQVIHIPNSGWPGTPRNVGIGAARGEYVQFVDNDDALAPGALEALYALASSSAADVVVGKLSSDFRGVNHTVFRHSVVHRTLADYPLVETLTPHKMFRSQFLAEHGIRYPEGHTLLDDQVFVMHAYARATSVAVLGDQACYFYRRRLGAGRNAGDVYIQPREYYEHSLGAVLDVIDAEIPPGELRDRLHRRFYRVELLGRLSGSAMAAYDDAYRAELLHCVRTIITERFAPGVYAGAGAATRVQGRLVADDDLPGLVALAKRYDQVTLRATGSGLRWIAGVLRLDLNAALYWGEEPLRCEQTADGWALPAALAPGVAQSERLIGDERDEIDFELAVVSRSDSASFGRVEGLSLHVDAGGVVRLGGVVDIDPATAMGGRALSVGLWDVRLRLRFAGWSRVASLRPVDTPATRSPLHLAADGTVVIPYWTRPNPGLALDVGQWAHALSTELARTATVEMSGNHAVRVQTWFAHDTAAPMPAAELLLEPLPRGELVSCPLRLVGDATGASAVARLPRLPRLADGVDSWALWLQVGPAGGAPPVVLPWQLRRRGNALSITVPDPVAEPAAGGQAGASGAVGPSGSSGSSGSSGPAEASRSRA